MPSTLVKVMARCERIAWKTNCFRDVEKMLNSTTVALNLANTHRCKPQSCRSPDDGWLLPRDDQDSYDPEGSTRESHTKE